MAVLSDAVVIGTVLSLVFAAVAYYLYSRLVQVESKLGLMENILLDLKVTTEQALLSPSSNPTYDAPVADETHEVRQVQFEPSLSQTRGSSSASDVVVEREEQPPTQLQASSEEVVTSGSDVYPNFEAMTYKELVVEARKRKVSGYSHMSKAALCDALRKQFSRGATEPEETVSLTQWTLEQVPESSDTVSSKEPEAAMSVLQDQGITALEGESLVA